MKSALTSIVLILFITLTSRAQIIVNKGFYKASFSNTLHQPKWVSYRLFKGGGDCPRDGIQFKCDDDRLQCATDDDYKNNNVYEKGHLANAEDFAFDCEKDEMTFRYYNCLPQTTNLNKGIWKTKETLIREWSKTKKLYIICGGYFRGKKMRNVDVPSFCWKVVQSVSTKEVLFCGWFSNTSHATVQEISVSELEEKLHSRIILLK